MPKLLLKKTIFFALPAMQMPQPFESDQQPEVLTPPQLDFPPKDELPDTFSKIPAGAKSTPAAEQAEVTNGDVQSQGVPTDAPSLAPTGSASIEGESPAKSVDSKPSVDSSTKQTSLSGETDGSTSTATVSSDGYVVTPPKTFLESYWYCLPLATLLVLWILFRLFSRRAPSFENQYIDVARKAKIANPRGQFKKSERFSKPKGEEDSPELAADPVEITSETEDESSEEPAEKSRPDDPEINDGKLTNTQQANTMKTEQPGDDEFDFDLNEGGDDSDVFSLEDAAEIDGPVEGSKKESGSKRFKTEADVEASQVESDDMLVDDDEFVAFDDEDSQLSLADSDEEFGFDLDDEEPNNFLDSGNLAAEVLPEAQVDDDDLVDLGLGEISGEVEDATQQAVEAAGADENAGTVAGMAAAAATVAGVAGGAAAAKKGGFFSRMFGGKKKKSDSDTPIEDGVSAEQIDAADTVDAAADVVGQTDQGGLSDTIESTSDSLSFDEFESTEEAPTATADSDDFDFDLEAEDDTDVPAVVQETDDEALEFAPDSSDSDDSDELLFDLDYEDDESTSDTDLPVAEASATAVAPAVEQEDAIELQGSDAEVDSSDDSDEFMFDLEDEDVELSSDADSSEADLIEANAAAEIDETQTVKQEDAIELPGADAKVDSSDDSDEFMFDLEDEDVELSSDADLIEANAAAETDEPETVKQEDSLETSDLIGFDDEVELEMDSDDSGELLLDSDDSEADKLSTSDVELAEDNITAPVEQTTGDLDEPEEEIAKVSNQADPDGFGFGVFENEAEQTVDVSEPAEAVAKVNSEEADSNFTGSAIAAATAAGAGIAGIAFAGKGGGNGSDSEVKELQAKLKTLETKNQRLTAEVAELKQHADDAATKNAQSETLQTQLDESQQERKVLVETVETLTSEKDELKKEKDSIDSEKKSLSEELETIKGQLSTFEQEKADLLKRQEELEAEKEAVAAELKSASSDQESATNELASLKAEITAFSDERSSFESEIKALEKKLADAEAKPATADTGSGEDIEDLRKRFKLRLGSEHRKRKEAQLQVDEAEAQRNDVAKLLRAAKAEIAALKSQTDDDDDFVLAD